MYIEHGPTCKIYGCRSKPTRTIGIKVRDNSEHIKFEQVCGECARELTAFSTTFFLCATPEVSTLYGVEKKEVDNMG